ncbi:hypothetical protein NP493_105g02023 [Ridgeia piscesae]|uniref:Uncharacterized protein n=1 Tax=Ridgeia piscesae TaxID=27915 RepID=A0AAD9P7B7_RIDPI|nr:hypothetical protein NP493_105g02023 [Ridgeia piscesae]
MAIYIYNYVNYVKLCKTNVLLYNVNMQKTDLNMSSGFCKHMYECTFTEWGIRVVRHSFFTPV